MESSSGVGFMAVFAVSGSVALVALQLHKRLLSDFMKKVESELGEKQRQKRRVRFADDVLEPSSNNKEYRMRRCSRNRGGGGVVRGDEGRMVISNVVAAASVNDELNNIKMPANRRALYEGVIKYRALKGHNAALLH